MSCMVDDEAHGQRPRRLRQAPRRWRLLAALLGAAALAGCGSRATPPLPPPPPPVPVPVPVPAPSAAAPSPAPVPPPRAPAAARPAPPVALAPPRAARDWNEFKRQAAQRLVAANPERSYMGKPPEPLLAIPVLEVELNRDGSVKAVNVRRRPRQAVDTIELAIAAVHRAAPYGDVSRLPRPWAWTEVFLFDDERRFKPATLDQ